ncbi:MAG: glycoside hydrolase family 20 zincin-like fold domain-containing protein [Kiritimatiellia bacterium]|nr:glycoside hydrolase family 20 zincin-like fold domain-containing protein [Kiritimatiellia bacterium]
MPTPMIQFLPTPTHLQVHPGTFTLPDLPTIGTPASLDPRVGKMLHTLFPGLHHIAHHPPHPDLRLVNVPGTPESYRLRITPEGVHIAASDAAGHFYALQTLRHIRRQSGVALPCLEIDDAPVWPLRGYYLDISRGRVPRLAMLKRRIQLLAALKINHLQLYFEHPFRFQFDPDIAGDGDAVDADDMIMLDAFCREHFIELVPSFTCFGHLGRLLSLPRYRDLAEAEFPAPSWEEATWLQRLRGATLYSRDPDAQNLLRRILAEFLPCFSSSRFNLCGDETHDLGRRTPDASPADLARQYLDHIRFLHKEVAGYGKSLMLWGDMLLQHPAAISELPDDCAILDWAYFPGNHFEKCDAFISRGLPTVVCPSVRGFGRLFNAVEEARAVLVAYARTGHALGAQGVLTTDWGDYGHFNMPPCALHGLALGAQLAWNPLNDAGSTFDRAFSRMLFDAPDAHPADLFSRAGSVADALAAWPFWPLRDIPPPADPVHASEVAEHAATWADAFSKLTPSEWVDETDHAQLALACRFLHFSARVASGAPASATRPLLDELEKATAPLWFAESQPYGLLDLHQRGFEPMRHYLGAMEK